MSPSRARPAAVTAVLFIAGFTAVILAKPGGHQVVLWVDDAGTFAAALTASVACAVAAWRNRAERRAWALVAAGVGAWAIGELIWGIYELGPRGSVPFPSLADVGYLGGVPLMAAGVLLFRSGGRLIDRTRSLLDGMLVGGSLLLVSWSAVLGPLYRSGSGSRLAHVIAIAYPVGDVIIGSVVVTALARTGRYRHNPLLLVGLGMLAMAVSDSTYTWLTANNAYGTGNLIDAGWIVAYLLVALAARTACEPHTDAPLPNDGVMTLAGILLPYGVLSVAFVVTLATAITSPRDDGFLIVAGAVLVALVVVRQLLVLLDNRRLTADLYVKVAELGAREEELAHLAFHDPLTGLPNRSLFGQRVIEAVAARAEQPRPLAIMFLDLDDFKTVNDSLGHGAGDRLLVAAARCLQAVLGPTDLAARLGGDEFGVLLDDPGHPDAAGGSAPAILASRLLDALRRPVVVAGRDLVARASIGIAHSHTGQEPADELLRQADTAMYAAKQRGKGAWEVFDRRMAAAVEERLLLHTALTTSLEDDALELHYQPIVDLATGELWGREALSRWVLPGRGPVPPAVFIPLAEEHGLIHELGRWSLLRACEEAARWGRGEGPVVTVNVSAIQLADATIVGIVAEALAVTGLPADRLVLEITESVLMRHADLTPNRLRALHDLGVQIAIDDFGTGYSSLSYLPRFPVDIIKIDQSLVRAVEEGPTGLAVVRAIVELAQYLGVATIAEGIEAPHQAEAITRLGCRRGQGYHFGRPLPAAQLARRVRAD